MWQFFAWLFYFRGRPLPRAIRLIFTILFVGLVVAVVIYTVNLTLTLDERTGAHHVHTHSTH